MLKNILPLIMSGGTLLAVVAAMAATV